MDVNQVRFGNYSIGNPSGGAAKRSEKQDDEKVLNFEAPKTQNVDADDIFAALGLAALQNKAQIGNVEKKEVNPLEYLSQDRIADIEAAMAEFENGVNTVANALDAEFPGAFAPDQRNALAASIYARD